MGRLGHVLRGTAVAGAFLLCATATAQANQLLDFSKAGVLDQIKKNGGSDVTYELVDTPKGKALEVTCTRGSNSYPGIQLVADNGAWDLSKFGAVEFELENLGSSRIGVSCRVDNAGDWKKNPWNCENAYINPKKKKTATVYFGYSWGKKAFKLDSAKVSQVLLFTGKPKKEVKFRITGIRAVGKPGDKPNGAFEKIRPKNGILAGGSIPFTDDNTDARGSETNIVNGGKAVNVSFLSSNKDRWPGVFFKAGGKNRWDLSDYNQVEFKIRNTGDAPARVFARVDNRNANGKKDCVNADTTIPAGGEKTVVVPFVTDQVWDGNVKHSGLKFNSSDVMGVLVFTEMKGKDVKLQVSGIRASVATPPTIPEWLGKKPPAPGEWSLTFEDNFNGTEIDKTKWNDASIVDNITDQTFPVSIKNAGSWWDKRSINTSDNVIVKDGCLSLMVDKIKDKSALPEKVRDRKYTNAVITTFGKFTQKYGYFESRMKLPTTMGMWPAFWLMPDRGKEAGIWWKRQGTTDGGMEFDIMEHLVRFGRFRYNIAMHWNGYKKGHKSTGTEDIYVHADKDGFITSGLLWEPGKATFYCNGRVVGIWENEAICKVPEYIMYTMPTGGWGTGGYVDESKLPAYYVIDYVRVWQRSDLKDK